VYILLNPTGLISTLFYGIIIWINIKMESQVLSYKPNYTDLITKMRKKFLDRFKYNPDYKMYIFLCRIKIEVENGNYKYVQDCINYYYNYWEIECNYNYWEIECNYNYWECHSEDKIIIKKWNDKFKLMYNSYHAYGREEMMIIDKNSIKIDQTWGSK
jgi:hypothetical protein